MKTGIGQSKYCTPQPFSRCLISLCRCFLRLNALASITFARTWELFNPRGGGDSAYERGGDARWKF